MIEYVIINGKYYKITHTDNSITKEPVTEEEYNQEHMDG